MIKIIIQSLNYLAITSVFICTQSVAADENVSTNKTQTVCVEAPSTNMPERVVSLAVSGMEGKTVRVKVINQRTNSERTFGPFDSPKTLTLPDIGEGYFTINIEVFNTDTEKWEVVSQSAMK